MKVEMGHGDVVDRVTILRIKEERITDAAKVANVRVELSVLLESWAEAGLPDMESLDDYAPLKAVNEALWDVEDELRDHERRQDFGADFVERARAVYKTNDRRAALKKRINLALGSQIIEEKSYAAY